MSTGSITAPEGGASTPRELREEPFDLIEVSLDEDKPPGADAAATSQTDQPSEPTPPHVAARADEPGRPAELLGLPPAIEAALDDLRGAPPPPRHALAEPGIALSEDRTPGPLEIGRGTESAAAFAAEADGGATNGGGAAPGGPVVASVRAADDSRGLPALDELAAAARAGARAADAAAGDDGRAADPGEARLLEGLALPQRTASEAPAPAVPLPWTAARTDAPASPVARLDALKEALKKSGPALPPPAKPPLPTGGAPIAADGAEPAAAAAKRASEEAVPTPVIEREAAGRAAFASASSFGNDENTVISMSPFFDPAARGDDDGTSRKNEAAPVSAPRAPEAPLPAPTPTPVLPAALALPPRPTSSLAAATRSRRESRRTLEAVREIGGRRVQLSVFQVSALVAGALAAGALFLRTFSADPATERPAAAAAPSEASVVAPRVVPTPPERQPTAAIETGTGAAVTPAAGASQTSSVPTEPPDDEPSERPIKATEKKQARPAPRPAAAKRPATPVPAAKRSAAPAKSAGPKAWVDPFERKAR